MYICTHICINILSSSQDIDWTEKRNQVYLQEREEVRKAFIEIKALRMLLERLLVSPCCFEDLVTSFN